MTDLVHLTFTQDELDFLTELFNEYGNHIVLNCDTDDEGELTRREGVFDHLETKLWGAPRSKVIDTHSSVSRRIETNELDVTT